MRAGSVLPVAVLIGFGIASTALGSKIVVPDPGNDVDTIQDALDIAQDGDVIEILPGEYRGNFTVTNVPNLVTTRESRMTTR